MFVTNSEIRSDAKAQMAKQLLYIDNTFSNSEEQ